MILIDNVYVQKEILTTYFRCNLDVCHGACCTHGNGQTPVTNIEAIIICDFMNKCASKDKLFDEYQNSKFIKIKEDNSCIFSYIDKNMALCKMHPDNKMIKPSYCRLFPIILQRKNHFNHLTLEKRDICSSAFEEKKIFFGDLLRL